MEISWTIFLQVCAWVPNFIVIFKEETFWASELSITSYVADVNISVEGVPSDKVI